MFGELFFGYVVIILTIATGALESPDLPPSCSVIAVALHITIILIILTITLKSLSFNHALN